jgi:PKHD-type hydroxylase
MGISINYPVTQRYANFLDFAGVFSPVECADIIQIGKDSGFEASLVLDDSDPNNFIGVPSEVRTSNSAWIPTINHIWIMERLLEVTHAANESFQFDIDKFDAMLQITRYETGQQYKWHVDNGAGEMAKRKISLVTHLNDPMFFEGGGLQFFNNRAAVDNRIGATTAFPSFELHRAMPVTSGTRYSLVTWVNGRPFR